MRRCSNLFPTSCQFFRSMFIPFLLDPLGTNNHSLAQSLISSHLDNDNSLWSSFCIQIAAIYLTIWTVIFLDLILLYLCSKTKSLPIIYFQNETHIPSPDIERPSPFSSYPSLQAYFPLNILPALDSRYNNFLADI